MVEKDISSFQYDGSSSQVTPEVHSRLHENLLRQQKAQKLARKIATDDPPRWAKWCIECPHCPPPQTCSCHDSEEDKGDVEVQIQANLVYQGGNSRDVTRFCEAWRQRDEQGAAHNSELRSDARTTTRSQAEAQPPPATVKQRSSKNKATSHTSGSRPGK